MQLADLLVVKPGEVVPVDGLVEGAIAVVDESALTGESMPVERPAGDAVRSGAVNAGGPFDLRVTTTAADSTYAGIVRMVADAQAQTAPSARLADRYAGVFLAASLALAAASWALSGELSRAVAVLVVATPCPLILAVPVALISGLSRAAQRGVVIKGGAVLERLAKTVVLLFDKTGTLTAGRPTVTEIVAGTDLLGGRRPAARRVGRPGVTARARRLGRPRGPCPRAGRWTCRPTSVKFTARAYGALSTDSASPSAKASWVSDGSEPAWLRVGPSPRRPGGPAERVRLRRRGSRRCRSCSTIRYGRMPRARFDDCAGTVSAGS